MKSSYQVIGIDSSAESCRVAVCSNGNIVELAKVDLYAMFHIAQCRRRSVTAVDGEEIYIILPGKFDLRRVLAQYQV